MQSVPSETIARQIRQRRQLLGWTRDQLAEHCAAAGLPALTPAALTNIETGRPDRVGKRRREITVEELFVLAYVMRFNPIDLMVAGDAPDDDLYPVTPGETSTVATVRAWIAGTEFLPKLDSAHDLAIAIQGMPKDRARDVSKRWFTPDRQQESNRAALEYDRARSEETESDTP